MKSRYLFITLLFAGLIALMVYDATVNEANSHTSGAAAMRTGSPGDGGATCKNCHAGPNPTTQAGMITSTIPAAGYTAGQTYTVTATVTRNGHTKFGFEISPQNPTGTQLGTLIITNTTETQLVGSGKYITHKSAGVTGTNSRTWTFNWTAPAAGTGNVTFYGAFNITNAMNNSSGDTTVLSTLTVSECAVPAQPGAISGPAVICPNTTGAQNYSIAAVSGATSYTWTSPAGWTGSSTTNSISLTPGTSGGNITVAAVNACGTGPVRSLAVTVDQLSVSASSTNISCNGGSNGTATAAATAGSTPYTYLWSPGGGTSATISNLGLGTYTVTVTDANSCTGSAQAVVTQPVALAVVTTPQSAHCGGSNGSAAASVTGGTAPYTYSWNTIPVQTTATATNLAAGNYTVTVTDAHNCTASAPVTITNVAGPTASIGSSVNVSCHGGSNGSAMANHTGGTAPFTYAWSPIGGTAATASNLPAGNYTVTITDANNCTSSANVSISEPSQISLGTNATSEFCGQSNGTATVTANGGIPGYTYSWNTVPVQTTASAFNLAAGNYTVTVTDANLCTSSAGVTVTSVAGPTATASVLSDVKCHGGHDGQAVVTPAGGTAPYSYLWQPSGGTGATASNLHAGAYSVTVTDANSCTFVSNITINEPSAIALNTSSTDAACGQANGSASVIATGGVGGYQYSWNTIPVQTTDVAVNLAAGSYIVSVSDSNGCNTTATVGVNNISGPVLTAGPSSDVNCFNGNDGSLSVSVAGGTGPFTFLWSPSGGTDTVARNLHAGAYSVTVTDSLGCISVLTGVVNEPSELIANAGFNQALCLGNTVVLGQSPVASGGSGSYTYLWSPATELSSATDSMPVASSTVNTTYTLYVTDAHNCVDSSVVDVLVLPMPLQPVITPGVDSLICSPAAAFQWYLNGNLIPGATDQFYLPNQNGNYSVTIIDANGCSAASLDYSYNSAGIQAAGSGQTVSIYPNPAGSKLVVELNGIANSVGESGVISIYALTGERVMNMSLSSGANVRQEVDVRPLPPGVYLIQVTSTEILFRERFVKE